MRVTELFSAGNHMVASWGYGKVGRGGRHLIPLKWANKMSYHTNLRGRREFWTLLSLDLFTVDLIHRVSGVVKLKRFLQDFFSSLVLIVLMESVRSGQQPVTTQITPQPRSLSCPRKIVNTHRVGSSCWI